MRKEKHRSYVPKSGRTTWTNVKGGEMGVYVHTLGTAHIYYDYAGPKTTTITAIVAGRVHQLRFTGFITRMGLSTRCGKFLKKLNHGN